MTIEEMSSDILKSLKMDSKTLFEMKKLLDEYVSLFNDNKIVKYTFSCNFVNFLYLKGIITPQHFLSYLRFAINFGNRLNLSDEEFLSDAKLTSEIIHCAYDGHGFGRGYRRNDVFDSKLLNDLYNISFIIVPYASIPFLFKELILIAIYKNIYTLGYDKETYKDFYDKVSELYTKVMFDNLIIEHLKLNDLANEDNISFYNRDELFSYVDDYVKNMINNGKRNVITR